MERIQLANRSWFDGDKAITFTELSYYDNGEDLLSINTREIGKHEELYLTKSKSWVLCYWTEGEVSASYKKITKKEAKRWLSLNNHEIKPYSWINN